MLPVPFEAKEPKARSELEVAPKLYRAPAVPEPDPTVYVPGSVPAICEYQFAIVELFVQVKGPPELARVLKSWVALPVTVMLICA